MWVEQRDLTHTFKDSSGKIGSESGIVCTFSQRSEN